VAILPYIDQDNLYRQFHLDEPWDSPHNLRLLPEMPKSFLLPGQPDDGSGRTYYQVFVGKGTLFEEPGPPPGVKLPPGGFVGGGGGIPRMGIRWPTDIPDGTSNTILIATARNSVLWTKPDDLPYSRGFLPPLGGHQQGGFHVSFADGTVRLLPQTIPEQTLRAMITRNGGEVVPWP
jgi:hypothetical protein